MAADVQVVEPTTVVKSNIRNATIKGTWTMFWGTDKYEFEDGNRYPIPVDLYEYLKGHGNIYDVLR
jgi:hypothetical protein